MITVQDIYQKINEMSPFSLAMGFDNCGLLVGTPNQTVSQCIIALDITNEVIDLAIAKKADLIITHHPIIFHAMKTVTSNERVFKLIQNNISVISAHTNLDIAQDGVNDILAKRLSLQDVRVLENCDGVVRMGNLQHPMSGTEFAREVKEKLKAKFVQVVNGSKEVKSVAVCGGSGDDYLQSVIDANIDVLVTGEVDHDVVIDAINNDITLICAGHHYTEAPVLYMLENLMKTHFSSISICLYDDLKMEVI
ncbi:Nif3-like dinuclear metal center hexameric protein [Paludicola sp. MB14-C6]|uniref:Nif3-like dinuclear metal center hexameric protein n=1 Tax=Paludihabitans sp. MB14-C6 TaxID=3070656 RepID=UPI0027DE674F|nr:Nif3-like dinuclear metal center hexameric protein [Paludicola sp. MB14-C6]WMJ23041.1 Nif3-like dinuclear metal center hexameric protein [Paludicola sp. MB14-C6]